MTPMVALMLVLMSSAAGSGLHGGSGPSGQCGNPPVTRSRIANPFWPSTKRGEPDTISATLLNGVLGAQRSRA